MSSSLTLFERQPQSVAVCYLYPLYPSQNTPSCYFASSALTLKAFKGKTAEGENNRCIYNHPVIVIIFPSNVLRFIPTGKSYPPLRQEMQEAFRPEHMRQEAECARVDFPCPSSEQDLRKGKMMTMTLYPPQRGFCIVALA